MMTLILLPLFLGQDSDELFFRLKEGTSWTYVTKVGGKALPDPVVVTILRTEAGALYVRAKELWDENEEIGTEQYAFFLKEGQVIRTSLEEGKHVPYLCVYKLGSKEGDTWRGDYFDRDSKKAKATHMGTQDLSLPAGTIRDVHHILIGSNTHFYWSRKVGLVKMEWEREKRVLELKEFKERS